MRLLLALCSILANAHGQDFLKMFGSFLGSGVAPSAPAGGGGANFIPQQFSSFIPLLAGSGGGPGANMPFGDIIGLAGQLGKGRHGHRKGRGPKRWRPFGGGAPPPRPPPPPPPPQSPVPTPSAADYDSIDFALTRPQRTLRDLPIPAPAIKRPLPSSPFSNLINEVNSFTPDKNYGNVEKIMAAFSQTFIDPSKPRQAILDDQTEVGRNRKVTNELFESDIVLTEHQMRGIVLGEKEQFDSLFHGRRKRKVITGSVYRWTDRTIPYTFKELDQPWRNEIRRSLDMWQHETCLRFQENMGAKDHIVFYKGSGCFSSVGRTGGSQPISIGRGCDNTGIITHEVAHALGFWHEQSRPDRDNYITVRRQFVAFGTEFNFLRQTHQEMDDMGLPYDMGSLMHYGSEAFSTREGERTITTNDGNYMTTIGQRIRPSFIDVKQINRLYCAGTCHGMQLACRHGGYPDPNNCQKCKCPEGLTGPICEDIPRGTCGGELAATDVVQRLEYRGIDSCVWRIRVGSGNIRMRISNIHYKCHTSCNHYVEVKHKADFQLTGFRLCCDGVHETITEGGEALIISNPNYLGRQTTFSIEYMRVTGTSVVAVPETNSFWEPGQEDRAFRGVPDGPVEQFILNAIPRIRDPKNPGASIASAVAEFTLSRLFGRN